MYGAERHISVLRSEIESNDVEYQNEKWSKESNMKHYKLNKEEIRSSPKTTTSTSTTTQTTSVTNRSATSPEMTTESGPDSTTESEFTTTDFDNFDTTTEFLTTTLKTETESKPQIFQDTLEKSSTTTEKAQMFYRTKGVLVCWVL